MPSSRRLDINSLLCVNQDPLARSPPPPTPSSTLPPSSPLLDPVILAPHLRNPRACPESISTLPHPSSQTHSPRSPPVLRARHNDTQQPAPILSHPFVLHHDQRQPNPESTRHQSHRPWQSHPAERPPYQTNSHPSSSSRSHSHSPTVSYSYHPPSLPSFSPPSSHANQPRLDSSSLSSQYPRPTSPLPFFPNSQSTVRHPSPSSSSHPPHPPSFHHPPSNLNLPSSSNTIPTPSPFAISSHASPLPPSPIPIKRPFIGLEALVHAASEERKRLSGSTASPTSSTGMKPATTPSVNSPILTPGSSGPQPSSQHHRLRHSEKDRRPSDVSPVSEQSRRRVSPPLYHHHPERENPLVGDTKERSDHYAFHPRHHSLGMPTEEATGSLRHPIPIHSSQHRTQTRVFSDSPLTEDRPPRSRGAFMYPTQPQHDSQHMPSSESSSNSPTTLGHRPHRLAVDTGNQVAHYPKGRSADPSSEPSHEFKMEVWAHSVEGARRGSQSSLHQDHKLERKDTHLGSTVVDLEQTIPSHYQQSLLQEQAPRLSEPDLIRRRRRASSPNSTGNTPAKKKQRHIPGSRSGPETTIADVHLSSDQQSRYSTQFISADPTPGNAEADVKYSSRNLPVEHQAEQKLNSSDQISGAVGGIGRQSLVDAGKLKTEQLDKSPQLFPSSEGSGGEPIEHSQDPLPDHGLVTQTGKPIQEQDPHEWLIEHYAKSPPFALGVGLVTRESYPSPKPQFAMSPGPKTPDADPVAHPKTVQLAGPDVPAKVEMDDTDLVSELVAETLDGAEHDPVTMEVDVEDELLSLVDHRPSSSHPPRKAPPSLIPLSPINYPPVQCPPSLSNYDSHSQYASPTGLHVTASSSSSFLVPAEGLIPPTNAPPLTSERGSMPPPSATTVNTPTGPPKRGERVGSVAAISGTKKKKDSAAKVPAKPKPPPKPRPKLGPKSKAKTVLHGSASTPTEKGMKGSPFPPVVPAAATTSVSAGASRSRSTSVMPRGSAGPEGDAKAEMEEVDVDGEDMDREEIYCICKTRNEEDRVMIACDRCDEWYHPHCVDMPDLEVDLVDQFICPPCIEKTPELAQKTTYKQRCLSGLNHLDPSSSDACHRPARGLYSKYCSDDCGIKYMQSRINEWVKKGGKRAKLWESVKDAEKREGFVVPAEEPTTSTKADTDVKNSVVSTANAKSSRIDRETRRLRSQLERIVSLRERIKNEMEVVLWRKRLLELAMERAENVDQCGWDQRLLFDEVEWVDFGTDALESYEEIGRTHSEDGDVERGEGEWWCMGKKKCGRHFGWQALRSKDVALETQQKEEALLKLTSQEREIRKCLEDIVDQDRTTNDPSETLSKSLKAVPFKGKTNLNGELSKRGRKRKNQ